MHFLRPEWAFAAVVFVLIPVIVRFARSGAGAWRKVCDAPLLQALLVKTKARSLFAPLFLLGVCWALAVFALCGPALEKLPQPTVKKGADVVYLLDISSLMSARDLKPSRMERAVFKLYDLLKRNAGNQSALILYAQTPFTAVPLTPDVRMIENLLPTVNVGLTDGGVPNLAAALNSAGDLLRQAKAVNGRAVVLGAFGDAKAVKAAEALKKEGYPVSVLGVGTRDGAPVQLANGSFATVNGQAVLSTLPEKELRRIAHAGGGVYHTVSLDEADIDALSAVESNAAAGMSDGKIKADAWKDLGAYVAALILPFMAFGFRRGWLGVLLLGLLPANAFAGWADFWQRADYKAAARLTQGQTPETADVFSDNAWKGAAQYRLGDYQTAADSFAQSGGTEDLYNYGNALAHAGKIQEAIKAYDAVLKQNPKHADAAFNKKYLKQQQQKNQQQSQQQNQQQNQQNNQQQNKQESGNGQNQNDQNQRQSQGRQQQQDSRQRQNPRQQPSEQRQQAQQRAEQSQGANGREQNAPSPAERQKTERQAEGEKQNSPQTEAEWREEKAKQEQRQWLSVIDDDPSGLLRERIRRHNLNRRAR